jgi:hypothetical protein
MKSETKAAEDNRTGAPGEARALPKFRQVVECGCPLPLLLFVAFITLLAAFQFSTHAGETPVHTTGSPKFGLWYTAWWTADDQFRHWTNCHVFPARGRYTAGDPAVIAAHYAQLRDLGVDFIIMDDTNGAGNDGGRINDNIRA